MTRLRATAMDRQMLVLFGVTEDEAKRVREFQENKCFVCRKPLKLYREHNHRSGEFRGYLCFLHNKGLAFFQDNPEYLAAAADYLRANPVQRVFGEQRFGRTGRVTRKWRTKREKRERMAWVEARLRQLGYNTDKPKRRKKK